MLIACHRVRHERLLAHFATTGISVVEASPTARLEPARTSASASAALLWVPPFFALTEMP